MNLNRRELHEPAALAAGRLEVGLVNDTPDPPADRLSAGASSGYENHLSHRSVHAVARQSS